MNHLVVISEKMSTFPHLACLFEYDTRRAWLGFEPGLNPRLLGAIGKGHLDDSSVQSQLGYFARFRVPTNTLWLAEDKIRAKYKTGSGYYLYARDCVTLAIDACRACGLVTPALLHYPGANKLPLPIGPPIGMPSLTPGLPNLFPHEVIWKLRVLNQLTLTHFGTDQDQPYPWN